ncbi:MAG: GxxExxY protein [Planctomycetes bacterium]|nr:GxxExxY protein [Planctomycetota bacterium]
MNTNTKELILKDEVYAIIGAAMEVYNVLGPGFYEAVCQEALEIESRKRGIPFEPQKALKILYKGVTLNKEYVADLLCFGQSVVELKAQDKLASRDASQVINYLKATGCKVGLLVNFGYASQLEWKRFVS